MALPRSDGVRDRGGLHDGEMVKMDEEPIAGDDDAAILARVKALAEQWNATPDYTPTEYDRGRVDQRHDMTLQLLEALTP